MRKFILKTGKSFGVYISNVKMQFSFPEDLRNIDYTNPVYKDIGCFAVGYFFKKNLLLSWISTNPDYFGNGYATNVINTILNIGRTMGKQYLLLDDCSGSSPPKNIYYKLGFKVKNDQKKWVEWTLGMTPDEERYKKIK